MIVFHHLLLLVPALLPVANGWFVPLCYNGTTTWSSVRHIDLTPPLASEAGGKLVYVLDAADPKRALRFEAANLTVCRPNLQLAYTTRYPRRAVSLANGKLVVWVLNYRLTANRHVGEWRFQIVEPSACSSADFTIRDADPLPIDVVDVVGYEDSFDVFLVALVEEEPRNLYVYRYGDDGKPASSAVISAIPDADSGPFYRPNSIRIHTVFKHDPTHGYFYLHTRPDLNSTTVKRLDSAFTIKKSIVLRHKTPLIYSTSMAVVTVCHFELENPWLRCDIYDKWLNAMSSLSLDYSMDKYFFYYGKRIYTTLENIPDGGVLLVHALKLLYHPGAIIIGQRIYADGSVSRMMEFGKVDCRIYSLRILQVPEGNHCITVSCDETVYTRCGLVK